MSEKEIWIGLMIVASFCFLVGVTVSCQKDQIAARKEVAMEFSKGNSDLSESAVKDIVQQIH